jgi:hypothetical protein
MPKEIYDNIPTKIINNIKYIDIFIIYLDKMRSLTDLITSNWRIEKDIERLYKLQLYYKLDIKKNNVKINYINNCDLIINEIIKLHNIIIIGDYASKYYIKRKIVNKSNNIEIITDNHKNIVIECIKILEKIENKKVTEVKYNPFF